MLEAFTDFFTALQNPHSSVPAIVLVWTVLGCGFAFLVWASLVGPIPLTGLSFAFEGSSSMARAFSQLGWPALLSLLYVVVVSTLFGFGAWTWLPWTPWAHVASGNPPSRSRHQASQVASRCLA